jgi:hypothetical protein
MSIAQALGNFFRFLSGSNQSCVTPRVHHKSSAYSDGEQVEAAREEQAKKQAAKRAARAKAAVQASRVEKCDDFAQTRIQLL